MHCNAIKRKLYETRKLNSSPQLFESWHLFNYVNTCNHEGQTWNLPISADTDEWPNSNGANRVARQCIYLFAIHFKPCPVQ